MYKKVSTSLDFPEREKQIIEFWKENAIFEKSVQKNEGGEEFSFYDGPPTANGKPHVGHILTRVMKDIVPRYHTMKGRHVLRKAGWDTHGLPVELEVEKTLGLDGKKQIETYGIEPFNKKCKESVWKYQSEWQRMSDRVGYWADMENPYVTYHDDYIESEWWAIKEMHKKGLLYKGHKIVPYCPRCGTALSSHEVAQGYKTVKETSAVVRFRLSDRDAYVLAWTTTPWTLPSNVALCMNPDENYAEIEADGVRYILAEALVARFFEEYRTISVKKGKEYEGEKYEPLFPYAAAELANTKHEWKRAYEIVCDAYVTLTDGTGVVHIAPAFGQDDYNVGKNYRLPVVALVNEQGRFDERCPALDGMFMKDADKEILKTLKAEGKLFRALPFEHDYPHCWRCDTPLLYYARSSWFIRVTAVKEKLIQANRNVNWIPETIKEGRMGNFLENVIDWGLSRDRYWGTPLPVWVCGNCGEIEVIGSRKELNEKCGAPLDTELHRPYVDKLVCKCPKCKGAMRRTPEVIDCWFDSGSMPFAQYHYPFENKAVFERTFPADFISEAVDQTRGWFYTLLTISTILFGRAPFKNCIVLGHVNDKNGVKMSKHKGNVVDPWTVLDKQGADAVRWYFYTNSFPWIPSRFDGEAVSESQRKFQGTLWNTYAFFTLYAEIDGYDPTKYELEQCKLTLMDEWVLSCLNTLVKKVDALVGAYDITTAARLIQDFSDLLSNWYVRRGRDRYWGGGMTEDKVAAYTTLYTVLVTLAKLLAPFTPFMAEMMYRNLVTPFYQDAPVSVHLCEFPVCRAEYLKPDLELSMSYVYKLVTLGRAARGAGNVKNRQPLSELIVVSELPLEVHGELKDVLLDELNVKSYRRTEKADELIDYSVKPQLRTLGPKLGKRMGEINAYFQRNPVQTELVLSIRKNGSASLADFQDIALTEEDLQIAEVPKAGYACASDRGTAVALDIRLTEELLDEGCERELVSKIQTLRKEAGFEVTDRIRVYYAAAEGRAKRALQKGAFAGDVLANVIAEGQAEGYRKTLDVNGEKVMLTVVKETAR